MKKNNEIPKEFTWEELEDARRDERSRISNIMCYILNKHVRAGEINYQRAYEEFEDYAIDLLQ